MRRALVVVAGLLLAVSSSAQESASHELTDHSFNAGGLTLATSTSYRVSIASLGEGAVESKLGSASYVMDVSFGMCYPPPGEVGGLLFTNDETLAWDAEPSVGSYNVYRGLLSHLPALGYGACNRQAIADGHAADKHIRLSPIRRWHGRH